MKAKYRIVPDYIGDRKYYSVERKYFLFGWVPQESYLSTLEIAEQAKKDLEAIHE